MKKYILSTVLGIGVIALCSFMFSGTSENVSDDKALNESEVYDFVRKEVYPQLEVLTTHDPRRVFSRCPSGFSSVYNDELSDGSYAIGTIYDAEGCSRVEFCDYKIDMLTKATFLKNTDEKEYLAIGEFIEIEKAKKIARM